MKLLKILLGVLFLITAARQTQAADLQKIISETQKLSKKDHEMVLVWWIPTAYWEEALKNESSVTSTQRAEIITTLEDYTVFAVVKGKFGAMASLETESREKLLPSIELTVDGKVVAPLGDDDIKPATQNLLSMLKPVLGNMLGTFGKGMEFIVYPNRKNSKAILDPRKKGAFDYKVGSEVYHWRLPLGSLLEPKKDVSTGDVFPGDFLYNPYTGVKL